MLTITDKLKAADNTPIARATVLASYDVTGVFLHQGDDSSYRPTVLRNGTGWALMTGLDGGFSFDVNWPSETKPDTDVQLIVQLSDTLAYGGVVPEGVLGPLRLDELVDTYNWGIVSTPLTPVSIVRGAAGSPGFPNNIPAPWDVDTSYSPGNGAYGSDGNLYIALAGGTNHEPPNGTYWQQQTTFSQATARTLGLVHQPLFNVHAFGARGDLQTILDGTMTSASAVLTSASGLFGPGDVGKIIHVPGAVAGGGTLVSSIAVYSGPTQVTLADSASAHVTTAGASWGTDDSGAIAAAITAAWAVAGTVEFSALGYMIHAALSLPVGDADVPVTDRRITFRGQGASWTYGGYQVSAHNRAYGTRLFFSRIDGSDCLSAVGIVGHTRTTYCFESLTIIGPDLPPLANGTGGTKVSGNGLYITGGTQGPPFVQIHDVEVVQFLGAGKAGVWLDNVEDSYLHDLRVTSNDIGLNLTGSNANTLVNVQAQLNASYGYYFNNCSSYAFLGCLVQSNIGAGMYINGMVGAEFLGLHFENNNTAGYANTYGLMLIGTAGNFNEHLRFRSCRFSGTSQKDTIYMAGVSSGYNVYITIDGGYCGINPPTKAVIIADANNHDITITNFAAPANITDNSGDGCDLTYFGQKLMRPGLLSKPSLAWNNGVIGMYYDPGTGSVAFAGPDGGGTLQQIMRIRQADVTLKVPLIALLPSSVVGDLWNITLNGVLRWRMENNGSVSLADLASLNLGSDGNNATGQLNVFGPTAGQRSVLDSNALRFKRAAGPSSINQEGGGALFIGTMNTALNALVTRVSIGVGDIAAIGLTGLVGITGTLNVSDRTTLGAPATATTDGALLNSQVGIWVNQSTNALTFRVKYSDGSLKTGTVALA